MGYPLMVRVVFAPLQPLLLVLGGTGHCRMVDSTVYCNVHYPVMSFACSMTNEWFNVWSFYQIIKGGRPPNGLGSYRTPQARLFDARGAGHYSFVMWDITG